MNMTRTIVTKLLLLMIFIFIICLPDLFTLYPASKLNVLCLPCKWDKRVKDRENWSADGEMGRKMSCDSLREACGERVANSSQTKDETWIEDPRTLIYMCETQGSVTELHGNSSCSAAKIHIEILVKLQHGDADTPKLTLYGHTNSSSLQLHPLEDETDDGGQSVAIYCCHQAPLTSETSNYIVCLVRLWNHTISSAAEKKELRQTQDEWSGMLRILWLVLLSVALLSLTLAIIRQMKRSGPCKKVLPHAHGINGHQTKGQNTQSHREAGRNLHSYEHRLTWSGLSSIEEVEVIDDAETVPDGHVDYSNIPGEEIMNPGVKLSRKYTFR
ncbi:uncharacterized protein LOC144077155 [Stigmatopora argus]